MRQYTIAAIITVLLLSAWVAAAPAFAEATAARQAPEEAAAEAPVQDWQPAPAAETATEPGSLAILDLLGKLTIAVLVAYGLAHGVRWLGQHGVGRRALPFSGEHTERELQLEETLPLGADGRLYLVTVSGKRVLLAAREGVIERIDLSDPDDRPAGTVYRAVKQRASEPGDELNIGRSRLSTRPVRADVVSDSATWAERRDQLLKQLQDT